MPKIDNSSTVDTTTAELDAYARKVKTAPKARNSIGVTVHGIVAPMTFIDGRRFSDTEQERETI